MSVDDVASLRRLLSAHPEIGSRQVQADLAELAAIPEYGATFERLITLFRDAATDPEGAWATFAQAMATAEEAGADLEQETVEINAAGERRDYDRVIELVDAAIPKASAAGLGLAVAFLRERRALALLNRPSSSRDEDIEAAIADFQEALALSVPGEQQADILMHSSVAFIERVRGDPAENLEQAIVLLRAALDQVEPENDPEMKAIVRTNLAMALVRRERGSRIENLHEAARLCRSALAFRSVERNAVDWAYSQLNYADVLELLSQHGEAAEEAADRARKAVVDEERRIGEKWLVGAAHHAIGRRHLEAAQPDVEALVDKGFNGFDDADLEENLQQALHHLQAAVELMPDCPDPLRPARVLADLSRAYESVDDIDASIEIGMNALSVLRPNVAPHACVGLAGRIGHLHSQRREWREAAAAYRAAVEAADLAFHVRLETEARETETRRLGNLSRWAAFAFARCGDGAGAVVTLDNGRARELQRRLGLPATDEARLAELPSDLREAYLNAVSRLRISPWGELSSDAGRQLQEILAEIRSRPGYGRFATGIAREDLAGAVERAWPLIYVNPTPYGTLFLTVRATDDGVAVESEFLDYPAALDVFMRLMAGVDADVDDADPSSLTSYLGSISGEAEVEFDLKLDLDSLLPWLGATVARPVRDILVRLDAVGATLVLCGPIGLAPIHAGSWEDDGRMTCLLDQFNVRYAPSAALCAASIRRADTNADGQTLVAVGDPIGDLAAAGPETAEIARLFGEHQAVCAIGAAATREFLQENAATATHLHLACHAGASLFTPDEAALFLADGPMSAGDVTGLSELRTRLVTISACQTALSTVTEIDEAFSIGTAMLVAGSACAVATLWPVDDLAMAYLMTRLYEEVLLRGRRPPEALRRAQLWLRDLTEAEEASFLSAHPSLASEFRRRHAVRRVATDRRSEDAGAQPGPFSHPNYWGACVAVGA